MTSLLLAFVTFFGTVEHKGAVTDLARKDAALVARRIKGRVLGSLIQKGMTPEQVEEILGATESPLKYTSYYVFAGGTICSMDYNATGVSVHLFHSYQDPGGVRVDRVVFAPLLPGPPSTPLRETDLIDKVRKDLGLSAR
jgi:hypothetical protein